MAETTTSDSGASSSTALQRGKACLRCRKRKMRCDGQKPACSQCVKARKTDACEYDDGKGKTRTQALRESIARLEERIRELQDPEYSSPSVTLYDPHSGRHSGSSSSSSPDSPGSTVFTAQSPFSIGSAHSPQPSWANIVGLSPPLQYGELYNVDEPPFELAQMLLEIFLPHRHQCGLEIHVERLRESLSLSSMDRPHPVLMNSIYLWSCFLSRPGSLSDHESHYLSLALRAIPDALCYPTKAVDIIQASCLLALYFFSNGRFSEGNYHACAATSLAIAHGLHRVASNESISVTSFGCSFGSSPLKLELPKDALEEGERISTFWQVFNLDRCWSVALQRPVCISDCESLGSRIDTPWPQSIADYALGNIDNSIGDSTIQRFLTLRSQTSSAVGEFSMSALRAKASGLLEGAARIGGNWKRHLSQPDNYNNDMLAFEFSLTRFISTLLPVQQLNATVPEDKRTFIVVHTLAYTAMIYLHERFAIDNTAVHEKCLRAARNSIVVIKQISEGDFDYLDPILGTCWLAVATMLLREIARIKTAWPLLREIEVYNEVDVVIYAMTKLAARFPLLALQLAELQEMLALS